MISICIFIRKKNYRMWSSFSSFDAWNDDTLRCIKINFVPGITSFTT